VKDLQQKWRVVGPVPREADHPLWEEFRQHCDAIFQKRQQEFTEYTAGLQTNSPTPSACVRSSRRSQPCPGRSCCRARGIFLICVPPSRQPVEFPREMRAACVAGLSGRWSAVKRQSRNSRRAMRSAAGRSVRGRKSGTCLSAGGRSTADVSERDALRQTAQSYCSLCKPWPMGGLEAIKHELAREGSSDVAANEAALKMLWHPR